MIVTSDSGIKHARVLCEWQVASGSMDGYLSAESGVVREWLTPGEAVITSRLMKTGNGRV
jgi:hypothetical protein